MQAPAKPQVFRPSLALGAAMGFAAALWLAALIFLCAVGESASQVVSAAALLVFFAVALVYYVRSRIVVDAGGLIVRTLVRTVRLSFADIRHVEVLPGPVTVYAVRAQGRLFHFTSFFRQHRRLAALLVDRAGLCPNRP